MSIAVEYPIRLHEGVGPINFGMSREDVRRVVGEVPHTFRRGPFPKTETDAFQPAGIFAYYDEADICHAVEFGGHVMPTLNGEPLLHRRIQRVEAYLRGLDPLLEVHNAGLRSVQLGVGIYVSRLREDRDWERNTEGVLVFDDSKYG